MERQATAVFRKVIGDTVYIIESEVSPQARESTYEKVKRLIMNDPELLQIKASYPCYFSSLERT